MYSRNVQMLKESLTVYCLTKETHQRRVLTFFVYQFSKVLILTHERHQPNFVVSMVRMQLLQFVALC